jgi:hypothetical protein
MPRESPERVHASCSVSHTSRESNGETVWIYLKVRRCFRDFVASIPSQVASFSA